MIKHKLLDHLKKLERRTFSRFIQFIQSPYHNKHKGVIQLVDYLNTAYPAFQSKNCDRNTIIRKAFKDDISYEQLAVLFTYTYKLLHKFYRIEVFKNNQEAQDVLLLASIKDVNNQSLFYEVLQQQANKPLGLYNKYRLEKVQESFENSLGKITNQEQFTRKQKYLDHFYFLEKIYESCEGLTLSRIAKADYPNTHIDALLPIIKKEAEENIDLKVYVCLYQTINFDIPFEQGLHEIQTLESKVQIIAISEVYNLLQNFCIYQINQGDNQFLKHAFTIYEAQLDKGLLLVENVLPEGHYKNIVTIALRVMEFDWTLDFIHRYKEQLADSIKYNAFNLNLANYYFAIGQYEQAKELLLKVDLKDIRYALAVRALQVRTYYEVGEFEALNGISSAFKQYLSRNKQLNENRVQGFIRLLNLTIACAKYKQEKPYQTKAKNAGALQKIQSKLETKQNMINRTWIEQKVKELEDPLIAP